MSNPGGGRGPSRERDRNPTGRSGSRRRRGGGRGGRGGGCVEQRKQWEDPLATQSDREFELSQTNRGAGGVCEGVVSLSNQVLARPPRAPWERAPARSPDPGKCGNTESYGKVQGSMGEGHHGICGMPRGLARRYDGGPSVERDLRQKPGVP